MFDVDEKILKCLTGHISEEKVLTLIKRYGKIKGKGYWHASEADIKKMK